MTIKNILEQLQSADHPVAKALHKGDHFKVLAIGFKSGMKIKDHKTQHISKLTCISGKVIYREGEKSVILEKYDETDIPINVIHSVEATEDSLCLLSQG